MCGILALFGNNSTIIDDTLRKKYLELVYILHWVRNGAFPQTFV